VIADVDQESTVRINEEVTLTRNLGLFAVTMIGVGGMIGAGTFALTGIAAGEGASSPGER
jgi:amino acid transporter